MSENTPPIEPPQQPATQKPSLEQDEVLEVLAFLKKYGKPAGIAIVAVCVIVLAKNFVLAQKGKHLAKADSALLAAQTPEQLQQVVNDFANTPSAPLALMQLAKQKFNGGDIDGAEAAYNEFVAKFADHEMVYHAQLHLITCKETRGEFETAAKLYDEFSTKHEACKLVAPMAMIGKARSLEALGKNDEARQAYEDIVVNHPGTEWSEAANANLKLLASK